MESPYRWVIVAAGGLLGCVAIGAMFSLPVFLQPMAKETGWSVTGISTAMTIGFLAMAVASMMYICHFELQRVAGPVFLSQIGYVMALTSLAGGTLLLGETLRPELIVTLGCVVAGTFLVRPARPSDRRASATS